MISIGSVLPYLDKVMFYCKKRKRIKPHSAFMFLVTSVVKQKKKVKKERGGERVGVKGRDKLVHCY